MSSLALAKRLEISDSAVRKLEVAESSDAITLGTLRKMAADCLRFQRVARADLNEADISSAEAGHCFWLSRNGHGTGFWDRDLGAVGDRLHAKAKRFGEFNLYVGDDGEIHGSR